MAVGVSRAGRRLGFPLALSTLAVAILFVSPVAFAATYQGAGARPAIPSCTAGGCTYVSETGGMGFPGAIAVISKSNLLIDTIYLPDGACPNGEAYDPGTKLVFVPDYCYDLVYAVDPSSNTIVGTIPIYAGFWIACDDAIPACYVTDGVHGTVIPFNPTTFTVGTAIGTCGEDAWMDAFDPVNGLLYVTTLSGCVTVLNPKTGATSTVNVGSATTGVTVAKSGLVYVSDLTTNDVYVIHGTKVVATTTTTGNTLMGAAYDSADNLVWVASYRGNTAIPVKGHKAGAAVSTGPGPYGPCYDSTNQEIFVPNSMAAFPGTVTVIKGTTVVATVSMAQGLLGESTGCASN